MLGRRGRAARGGMTVAASNDARARLPARLLAAGTRSVGDGRRGTCAAGGATGANGVARDAPRRAGDGIISEKIYCRLLPG
jgi:hypothetical protein